MERYTPTVHFRERLARRQITMLDTLHVLRRAPLVEPHPDPPLHDGTCWRVLGRDLDGDRTIGVGVEAFTDEGRRLILCTVIDVERGGR